MVAIGSGESEKRNQLQTTETLYPDQTAGPGIGYALVLV